MATSSIYRVPKTSEDGTIREDKLVLDKNGALKKVSEIIFTAESPTISQSFTDEINALIQSGQIIIPTSEEVGQHIVDISDQLEENKYEYIFVDKNGSQVSCGEIYRIFFNGINVTQDVDISGDRGSFVFSDLYPGAEFGYGETRLVIDFIQKAGE